MKYVFTNVTASQTSHMEDQNLFRNRRVFAKRSVTNTVKPVSDSKLKFGQYRTPQLTLKPLFFEVPLQEPEPLFLGRQWLIDEMETIIGKNNLK